MNALEKELIVEHSAVIEYKDEGRFALPNALKRLGQIKASLESFKKLTTLSQGKLSKKTLKKVKNTSWEEQKLGFSNWSTAVEGTLIKQSFMIEKLKLQVAQKAFESKEINRNAYEKQKMLLVHAKKRFDTFMNAFKVRD